MNNKIFYGLIAIVIAGLMVLVVLAPDKQQTPRAGDEQQDQGQQHLEPGQTVDYNGPLPPTSGPHAEHLPWSEYQQPVPEQNTIHNLEHGGIYISYNPELIKDGDLEKLRGLFFKPFSNPDFAPTKAVMAPRPTNKDPIVFSSWNRNQVFTDFDQQAMIDYYKTNINKSPEIAN